MMRAQLVLWCETGYFPSYPCFRKSLFVRMGDTAVQLEAKGRVGEMHDTEDIQGQLLNQGHGEGKGWSNGEGKEIW